MCDYSRRFYCSRMAQAGDRLMTVRIGATYGFALADDHRLGICLTPGTELVFDQPVATRNLFGARFSRWLNREKPRSLALFRQKARYGFRHDFLEFPDSHLSRVATLYPGQTATVLQIPPPRRTVRKKRRTPKEPKLTDVFVSDNLGLLASRSNGGSGVSVV
jgi:hypothetical protein